MSWFSSLKKAVTAPVRVGLAPIKATAQIARHPLRARAHLAAAVAAGLAPARAARATTATALHYSPHQLVVRRLRAAGAAAPTTFQGGATRRYAPPSGWVAPGSSVVNVFPRAQAVAWRGDEYDDDDRDDGGEELSGIDYDAYIDGGGGLAGFTDDLQRIGVNLAKGAASGILSAGSKALSPAQASPSLTPQPKGMSTTAKLAIGAAVAVPLLFVLTRRRSASTPVAV